MHALLPFTDLIQAFGWTILHSFWQGCCVFLCLRIVLWLWPQSGPSIKYHLSFLSLTGIAGWFGVTFATQWRSIREASEAAVMATTGGMGNVPLPAGVPIAFATTPAPADGLKMALPGMEAFFPILVGIYVVGVTVMMIRLCVDLAQLKTLRNEGLTSLGSIWDEHLDALARKMGIAKKVALHISGHLQVPVMIGFVRPVILLPVAMVNNLSPEQLEAILLHELAHIKRNDYLLNIFQSIVETLLFFNPFVWWISRNIRLEREHCCDDLVLASTVQPMHYAKALVALEEFRLTANPMAMAAAHDRHHLLHRIKRIMEMKTKHLNYSQRLLALMIIVTGLVSIAWLTPDGKSSQKEQKTDTVAPKPAPNTASAASSPSAAHSSEYFITDPPAPGLPAPVAVPCPPAPPAAPDCADAGGFITSPTAPIPPAAPMAVPSPLTLAAPTAPAPPMPPAGPMSSLPPMPPMPPTPMYNGNGDVVFYRGTGKIGFYASGDTVVPGGRIIIVDKSGKKKTYNSIDDMSADEKKEFEENYIKLQNQNFNFKFDKHFDDSFKFNFDSLSHKFSDKDIAKLRLNALHQLENINFDQLRAQMQMAMDMKWETLDESVRKNLSKEDWEKAMQEARKNIKDINWGERQKEVKKAIEELKKNEQQYRQDMEKYRKEAEKYRNEDMEKYRQEQAKYKATQEKYNRDAARYQVEARATEQKHREQLRRHEVERARHERFTAQQQALTEKNRTTTRVYNDLLKALETDKLIDRNEGFNVEKKGDDFYINGKKQSSDVKNKYKQYLENDNVTIKGDKTNLQIHAQNDK